VRTVRLGVIICVSLFAFDQAFCGDWSLVAVWCEFFAVQPRGSNAAVKISFVNLNSFESSARTMQAIQGDCGNAVRA
jgi:hypothetical protein